MVRGKNSISTNKTFLVFASWMSADRLAIRRCEDYLKPQHIIAQHQAITLRVKFSSHCTFVDI